MNTTIPTITSITRPTSGLTAGDQYFETDTKSFIIWDGTNWRSWANDGVYSQVASFDGTNDYIDTGTKFDFIQQTCEFSITCWVKFTDHTSTANNQAILSTNYTGSQKGFYLFYDNRGNNKTLRTLFRAGSSSDISVNNAVSDNDWFHVAVTCAAGGTQKLYVDGSVIGSTAAPSTTTDSAYYNMTLGAGLVSAVTPSYFFGGYLDEVSFFESELSSGDITSLISSHNYTGATSLYKFEGNANDSIGNNNGTNNGATFEGALVGL